MSRVRHNSRASSWCAMLCCQLPKLREYNDESFTPHVGGDWVIGSAYATASIATNRKWLRETSYTKRRKQKQWQWRKWENAYMGMGGHRFRRYVSSNEEEMICQRNMYIRLYTQNPFQGGGNQRMCGSRLPSKRAMQMQKIRSSRGVHEEKANISRETMCKIPNSNT